MPGRGICERAKLPHKQEAKCQMRNIVAMELDDARIGDAGGKTQKSGSIEKIAGRDTQTARQIPVGGHENTLEQHGAHKPDGAPVAENFEERREYKLSIEHAQLGRIAPVCAEDGILLGEMLCQNKLAR